MSREHRSLSVDTKSKRDSTLWAEMHLQKILTACHTINDEDYWSDQKVVSSYIAFPGNSEINRSGEDGQMGPLTLETCQRSLPGGGSSVGEEMWSIYLFSTWTGSVLDRTPSLANVLDSTSVAQYQLDPSPKTASPSLFPLLTV